LKKKEELDSQITACDELVERIRVDYYWLANAYHDVKVQRRDLLLGGDEFVAGITTAITTILSPVPAAFEQEDEYESQEDGSGDDTDDLGAPSTGQKVSGAFGGQFGGQKSESATVGFSADNTQTPPPPPARSQSGQNQLVDGQGQDPAAVAQAASAVPAAQAAPPAAVNSGHSTPDNQPAAVGQEDQDLTPEDREALDEAAQMALLRS